MELTLHLLVLVIAAIFFALAALNISVRQINTVGAGLFFLTLAFIF